MNYTSVFKKLMVERRIGVKGNNNDRLSVVTGNRECNGAERRGAYLGLWGEG